MEYSNPMEPRGAEGSVVVFHVHQRKDIGENYKEAFELWRERNPMMRINTNATLF
jgi:hypothetical protein